MTSNFFDFVGGASGQWKIIRNDPKTGEPLDAAWTLAQDERRKIFESQSHHTEIGLKYLPAIARKLYHCRDIGQPFDFLTWFEYAPEHAELFEELVLSLRNTEEWNYVEREIDIRLVKIQLKPLVQALKTKHVLNGEMHLETCLSHSRET